MNQPIILEEDEVDLVLEYERLEQEKLKLLQQSLSTQEEQTVEIIDDTVLSTQLYPKYEKQYLFGNASFTIHVQGRKDHVFVVSALSNRYNYILKNEKLIKSDTVSLENCNYDESTYLKVINLYLGATFDVIKEVFATCLPESDYSFNLVQSTLRMTIRLKDVYIKNDFSKREHKILDIMYILSLQSGSFTLNGARPTLTSVEHSCGYTHSHFSSGNTGLQYVCLGSGIMNKIITSLNMIFVIMDAEQTRITVFKYISAIDGMARYEDINGGPYFRIENIRQNRSSTNITASYFANLINSIVTNSKSIFNFVFEKDYLKIKRVRLNKKTCNTIVFDSTKYKELLNHLGIDEVLLDQNEGVISIGNSSQRINDSSVGLNNAIYWKDEVIRSAKIVGELEPESAIKTHPSWVQSFIYQKVNSIINSYLFDYVRNKKE